MSKKYWRLSVIGMLLASLFCLTSLGVTLAASNSEGILTLMSYNIRGNYGFDGNFTVDYSAKEEMGKHIQQHIDVWSERGRDAIVAIQEDWRYLGYIFPTDITNPFDVKVVTTCDGPTHTRKHITLTYQSEFHRPAGNGCDNPLNPDIAEAYAWNDGLNLFSNLQFEKNLYRETWETLEYQINTILLGEKDLAKKGFSKTTFQILSNFEIDVYNVHAGPTELRKQQFDQLTAHIQLTSRGKAVIVIGDTNLSWSKNSGNQYIESDAEIFESFLKHNQLKSACMDKGVCESQSWPYPNGVIIDQIMFRGNDQYTLDVIDFYQLDFPISDHEPVVAHIRYSPGKWQWEEPRLLTGLRIDGPDSISEASSETYVCAGEFDNGTTKAFPATWYIDQGDAYAYLQRLNDGSATLSARAVNQNQTVTIRCTSEVSGMSMTATKVVQIKDGGELFSVEIQGPDRIANTTFGDYSCFINWQQGYPEPDGPVEATWAVTEGQEYAAIEYGVAEYPKVRLLPTQQVDQEQSVTIQCEFIWAQETKTAMKTVVIYPIVGPGPGEEVSEVSIASEPLSIGAVLVKPNPDDSVEFMVQGQGIASLQVRAFNLGGQLVYDSEPVHGSTLRWNLLDTVGNRVPNGVYLYVVTVTGFNGEAIATQVRKFVVLN